MVDIVGIVGGDKLISELLWKCYRTLIDNSLHIDLATTVINKNIVGHNLQIQIRAVFIGQFSEDSLIVVMP